MSARRRGSTLVGIVIVVIGLDGFLGHFGALGEHRRELQACADELEDCFEREPGMVVDHRIRQTSTSADAGSTIEHHWLTWRRADGREEIGEVEPALYREVDRRAADEPVPVGLVIWRDEVVGLDLDGEVHAIEPPSVVGRKWRSLLWAQVAGVGVGLLALGRFVRLDGHPIGAVVALICWLAALTVPTLFVVEVAARGWPPLWTIPILVVGGGWTMVLMGLGIHQVLGRWDG